MTKSKIVQPGVGRYQEESDEFARNNKKFSEELISCFPFTVI
jgi:hypothetical protein